MATVDQLVQIVRDSINTLVGDSNGLKLLDWQRFIDLVCSECEQRLVEISKSSHPRNNPEKRVVIDGHTALYVTGVQGESVKRVMIRRGSNWSIPKLFKRRFSGEDLRTRTIQRGIPESVMVFLTKEENLDQEFSVDQIANAPECRQFSRGRVQTALDALVKPKYNNYETGVVRVDYPYGVIKYRLKVHEVIWQS